MADFILPLLSVKQESKDTKSFFFARQNQELSYQAGQFLRLSLPEVIDPRGSSRLFSFASSPTEKHILIATKISENPYKLALASLPVGEKVMISGPFGKFMLDEDSSKQHVFLSGGIGITPFRSILKFATDEKLHHKIVLLYSNQTRKDIVFKEDLETFAKENTNFTLVHTITKSTGQPMNNNEAMKQLNNRVRWKIGRIDEIMIREYVKDISNAVFYIAGPPSMVEALYTLVKGMGISEEHIKTERFTGYQ